MDVCTYKYENVPAWEKWRKGEFDLADESIYVRVDMCSYVRVCLWEPADHVAADGTCERALCASGGRLVSRPS